MARRQHLLLTVVLAFILFFSISYLFSSPPSITTGTASYGDYGRELDFQPGEKPLTPPAGNSNDAAAFQLDLDSIPGGLLDGESIAPKLENATLKAELGRATWKFLHTMVARFPEKPSDDDRRTLETFIHLFGRLYPCGDCARHFRELLAQYPPQTSSRNAAAGWLCFAHNVVNERLEKPIFDCNNIGDFYDCGCGEEGKEGKEDKKGGEPEGEESPQLELDKA